nr:hypothetical protein [Methanobacterium formicicum]
MVSGTATAANNTTEIITSGPSGIGGNGESYYSDISEDGNIITFRSSATDLIPGITTTGQQIFTYDRTTQTTTLITTGTSGTGGNGDSSNPSISGNGNIITFYSSATNLLPGITTTGQQIFTYDRTTQTTTLITSGSSGIGGNHASTWPSISGDGNIITFQSWATDLIPGITTDSYQIFAYDRTTQTTTLITTGTSGTGGNDGSFHPSISGNGNVIAFQSAASDLIPGVTITGNFQLFAYDRTTQTTTHITKDGSGSGVGGYSDYVALSNDGNIIVFYSYANDLIPGITTNGYPQIFAYNRNTQSNSLITRGSLGTGGNGESTTPSIDGNGNLITFSSSATDLIPGITTIGQQIFTYDRTTQTTTLITTGTSGTGGNNLSIRPVISNQGNVITFESRATDLVPNLTTNGVRQIFAFILREDPDDGDHNSDPESVPEVQATTFATKTIGMQNTGIPLVGIVLAFLMVIGGFVSTRKKTIRGTPLAGLILAILMISSGFVSNRKNR